MTCRRALVITTLILACCTLPCAADVLLSADFEDKPVDVAIGTGGASAGEPTWVDAYLTATVRSTPMPSRSLELSDVDDYMAGSVRFDLEGGAEVTEGVVAITADLWFTENEEFRFDIREADGSVYSFTDLSFDSNGKVWLSDRSGAYGIVGSYALNRVVPLRLVFNLDAATYDLWVDGRSLATNVSHGITERGIGRIQVGTQNDADLDGNFYVDNLKVESFSATECVASATRLCLNDGRFQVAATYASFQNDSGVARAVALTDDTGYFWFFSADNVEVVIKVLDGCGFNQHFWVFAAGLTNVEVEITVVDTANGTVNTYTNPMGSAFQPLQETTAFDTCADD